MSLYTDDNPITTLKGLGYSNREKALETIQIVEDYFDSMMNRQKIPDYTPANVLPRKYLKTVDEKERYYAKQKMYRILGMRNRAIGRLNKVKKDKDIKEAIIIFDEWLKLYKKQFGGDIVVDCCIVDETKSKKCQRKSDGKVFELPRRFSRKKCSQGIRGFTMRSSCAPFKDC